MPTLKITAKVRNDTSNYERGVAAATVTTTGAHVQVLRNTIGTTEETIAIAGDITGGQGPGYAFIYNADATNYVQVGIATGAYFMRLKAGESATLPLDSAISTLYLKSNTAACDVEVWIWER